MSTTIYIRVNGIHDNIQFNITEKTTIGDIKDQIINKDYAVDRSQIRLAYLGNIITSDYDNKTLFSMDNCSSIQINGKTIHAVIEKWSDDKLAQYKKTKEHTSIVGNDEVCSYALIVDKVKSIYDFVMDDRNTEFVTTLYNNGINKYIDEILIAFGDNQIESSSQPSSVVSDVIVNSTPIVEESQFDKDNKFFVIQLKVLEDMGFTIVERNIEALKQNNGNPESVINYFLDNGY